MTRYTAFRCPEDLLEKAKAKASRDRRSLSNYIITLIEKDVCGNGPAPARARASAGKTGARFAAPALGGKSAAKKG